MLKKLYEKNELLFSILWIFLYCVLLSVGDGISAMLGIEKSVTLGIGILLSAVLILFLKSNGLFSAYGLCRTKSSARSMLFYIPLILLLAVNLMHGVVMNYGALETVLYVLSMLCVGFLEELIFRGLLFNAMRKNGLVSAIIVSSLTFGIGHIINLINGSGAELIPNLLQVVYAAAAGFMFVMIYCKTDSLIACIAAHGIFNSLSAFAVEPTELWIRVISCVIITLITGLYGLYIALTMKWNGEHTV